MSFEQLACELPEIWDEDWFPPEDDERVRALARLIPDADETVLDIGCGNGLFLNHLRAEYGHRFRTLVGVDRSEAALTHVRTDKLLASIDCRPVGVSARHVSRRFIPTITCEASMKTN